jgi:hypothetical protein
VRIEPARQALGERVRERFRQIRREALFDFLHQRARVGAAETRGMTGGRDERIVFTACFFGG